MSFLEICQGDPVERMSIVAVPKKQSGRRLRFGGPDSSEMSLTFRLNIVSICCSHKSSM